MDEIDEEFNKNKITISVVNRTGKKLATNIYGFGIEYDLEKIVKHWQKQYHCTGSIENSEEFGEVIKLTGDQKVNVCNFLIKEEICTNEDIIIKGI